MPFQNVLLSVAFCHGTLEYMSPFPDTNIWSGAGCLQLLEYSCFGFLRCSLDLFRILCSRLCIRTTWITCGRKCISRLRVSSCVHYLSSWIGLGILSRPPWFSQGLLSHQARNWMPSAFRKNIEIPVICSDLRCSWPCNTLAASEKPC